MTSEMLPCPFCGGEAVVRDDTSAHGGFCVVCKSPDCFCALGEGYDRDAMPDHAFSEEDAAIAAWNTRPAPASSTMAEIDSSHAIPQPFDLSGVPRIVKTFNDEQSAIDLCKELRANPARRIA